MLNVLCVHANRPGTRKYRLTINREISFHQTLTAVIDKFTIICLRHNWITLVIRHIIFACGTILNWPWLEAYGLKGTANSTNLITELLWN